MKIKRNLIQLCLLCTAMLQTTSVGAQAVTKISAGYFHSLFLESDGSLWIMGDNSYGQLGDGTYNNTNRPEQIVASNVIAIAGGEYHGLFVKHDGSLWAMGWNYYGQLGDGSYGGQYTGTDLPEQIVASNVTAIAAGADFSLFLKNDGSLWAMGQNSFGQLGDGTRNNTNLPEQIVAANVKAIAGGGSHSLFLKGDGSLWAVGFNGYGQLGIGKTVSFTNQPQKIVSSNVIMIAAGNQFSLFLKNDGSLWAMGDNSYGQLGDGGIESSTNLPEKIVASNVTAIAAGGYHSLFIKNDGSLWGMGITGALGDGTTASGNYYTNRPEQIVANNVKAIAAGFEHSLFLKSDGSLWAMGLNSSGQLGDGTYINNTDRPEQIVAGPLGYNKIFIQLLSGGNVSLSYLGMAGTNYELDRTFSLSPANWVPQTTNPAGLFGALVFTNTPDPTTNNFWRVRSVP